MCDAIICLIRVLGIQYVNFFICYKSTHSYVQGNTFKFYTFYNLVRLKKKHQNLNKDSSTIIQFHEVPLQNHLYFH